MLLVLLSESFVSRKKKITEKRENLKLVSSKEEQRSYCIDAASNVGAAVLAHVARSGRSEAALR